MRFARRRESIQHPEAFILICIPVSSCVPLCRLYSTKIYEKKWNRHLPDVTEIIFLTYIINKKIFYCIWFFSIIFSVNILQPDERRFTSLYVAGTFPHHYCYYWLLYNNKIVSSGRSLRGSTSTRTLRLPSSVAHATLVFMNNGRRR
jgi:hypothetical protein